MRPSRSSPRRAITARRSRTWSRAPGCRSARSTRTSRGKEELFLHSCDLISGQGLDELADPAGAADDDRRAAARRRRLLRRDDRRVRRRSPGRSSLVRAWAEAGEEPGVREMLARRRERLLGAAQLLLQRGHRPRRAARTGSMSTAFARGFMALLDGLLLQRIEAGDAYRPEDSIRRATASPRRPACRPRSRATGRRHGVASGGHAARPDRPRPHRSGATSGSRSRTSTPRSRCGTSPRAGTTGSSPATSRSSSRSSRRSARPAVGSLVDLTMPGVGRDPSWLAGLARASGLNVVMGCGWYRGAYYPAEALDRPALGRRPGRRARPRGDRRRRRHGHPAGHHRRDRHRQALGIGAGGARPSRRGAGPLAGRGSAITTHSVLSAGRARAAAHLRGRGRRPDAGRHRPRRLVSRISTTTSRSSSAARRVEFDFLGMSFTPAERHGEARIVELLCELLVARARRTRPAVAGRLPRLAAPALRRATATRTSPRRSCRGSATPASATPRSRR